MKKKLIPFSIEEEVENDSKNQDESIRKALISYFQNFPYNSLEDAGIDAKEAIAWLKGQGEQETLCDKCKKLQPSHSCQDITALGRCAVEHEQKSTDKFEINPDKWYVCTCPYTGEDFLFLLNFPYLGKDLLKCHLPEDKNYQDFLRPWTDQDANSNEWASLVSYMDKNKKIKPKFKVGDVMRTLEEAKIDITEGLPVVVSIDDTQYHCTNETIDIKDQEGYEYPPMNAKYTHTHTVMLHRMTYRDLWWWLAVQRDYPDEKREYCYKSNSSYPLSPYEYSYKEEDADKEVEDILIRIDGGEWMEPLTDE